MIIEGDLNCPLNLILENMEEHFDQKKRYFVYCRFVNSMVYYGVFLSAPSIGGNMYLNFFLASIIELPAIPGGVWIYNRLDLMLSTLPVLAAFLFFFIFL